MVQQEQLERENSEKMNQEAVERIKSEVISKEEAERIEAVIFEYDVPVKLRDGKEYKIRPVNLKDAKRLMKLLGSVNVDYVIMNFLPTGYDLDDQKREADFMEVLLMAFKNYSSISQDYIEENVDIKMAETIIATMIGLNGLKK